MKVSRLIEILKRFDSELNVCVFVESRNRSFHVEEGETSLGLSEDPENSVILYLEGE